MTIDGVDVSGHWSTFIAPRVVTDYNESLEEEIAAFPGGDKIHRCFQCGSCTNACTINAIEPRFNPRYWIYLIRMGYESELLRDKDIIWQCVSCHKCTHICPRDVEPEGVMKATALWLEEKGYTPPIALPHLRRGVLAPGDRARKNRRHRGAAQIPAQDEAAADAGLAGADRAQHRHAAALQMGAQDGLGAGVQAEDEGWAKSRAAIEDYIIEEETSGKRNARGGSSPRTQGED